MPTCGKCGKEFPNLAYLEGKIRNLSKRIYCIDCSPFNLHNTKKLECLFVKEEKMCYRCGQTLPVSYFYLRRKGKDLSAYCKDCTNTQSLERQRLFKVKAVEYKGGKCERCGYNRFIGALDFHHTNSDEKDFAISRMKKYKFEKMIPELNKCVLVCANCHRELHNEIEGKKIDIDSFSKRVEKYQRMHNFKIDKQELEEIVANKSILAIAEIFGVTKNTVIKKCINLGIKIPHNKTTRLTSRKFDISKEELQQLVWEMPTERIAEKYGVSDVAIAKRCKKLGIEKPGRGYWAKKRSVVSQ